MRPVRIDLKEYQEFEKFSDVVRTLFNLVDEEKVRAFHDEMLSRYMQIVLDLYTGEVLQALTKDGYWVLTKFYFDSVPSAKEVLNGEDKPANFMAPPNMPSKDITAEIKKRQIKEAKERVEAILKKVELEGEDSLTRKEVKFLRDNSNLI